MNTVGDVRRENLERLIEQYGSVAALIRAAKGDHNLSPQYISQIRNQTLTRSGRPRTMGDDLARDFERLFGLEPGSMDRPNITTDPLERQLLTLYRDLSEDRRYKLLLRANELHNDQHPGVPSPANPYPALARVHGEAAD